MLIMGVASQVVTTQTPPLFEIGQRGGKSNWKEFGMKIRHHMQTVNIIREISLFPKIYKSSKNVIIM